MTKSSNENLIVKNQYIKDLSFENPFSPQNSSSSEQPKVSIDVRLNYSDLKKNDHEIIMLMKIHTTLGEKTLYILEIQYAGIFNFKVTPDNKKEFIVECAKILFPFVRNIISNLTRDGGYNPLLIQPFDFSNLNKNI